MYVDSNTSDRASHNYVECKISQAKTEVFSSFTLFPQGEFIALIAGCICVKHSISRSYD